MKQYFVTSEKAPVYEDFKVLVTSAVENGEHVRLHGEKESIPVEFDVVVHSVSLRRGAAAKIIEFTGVTVPENDLYVAEFHELRNNAPITLNIYRSSEL